MSQKGAEPERGGGREQGKPGATRRLGRGLSSLIGPAPVRVDVPPTPQTLDSDRQYETDVQYNTVISNPVSVAVAGPDGGGRVPADPMARDAKGVESDETPNSRSGLPSSDRVVMVAVGDVSPSRFQPREVFDEVKLAELAESIRSIGVMQPVIVRSASASSADAGGRDRRAPDGQAAGLRSEETETVKGGDQARYELVAGERRWRAAQLAGLTHVPAIVRDMGDDDAAAWGLIENVQREDLDPIEKGRACRVMMERLGVSPADVAARIGMDRTTIVNLVRLTELEPTIQVMVRRGEVTMGHAKVLLGVPPENGLRLALATLVGIEGWSVRKLEDEVKKVAKGKKPAPGGPRSGLGASAIGGSGGAGRSAALADLEKRLGEHLGTRVKIKTDKSGKRGRIEMAFFDLDHFEGLMQRVGFGGKA